MVKKISVLLITTISIFLIIPLLSAAEDSTYVLSNSQNWKDVYSSLLYSSLEGIQANFLTSTQHGTIILDEIKKANSILVISSKDTPYVYNYLDIINSRGFEASEEIKTDSANLELINEIPDMTNFVIVGDSYGYNAIAVAPYAVQKNSWVFFANNININEIDSILSTRNLGEVLIYGYVDKEVRDTLAKYNPKIIDTKNRFDDNIEIVKEYLEISPTEQVLLTNGEFIEKELMDGKNPTLFTGNQNVPDQIRDYLKDSTIEIGVLIGNDLIGAATNIKETAGINVMVKFARGARSQAQGVAAVEGLDLFPLPIPTMSIEVSSIKYNIATSKLEVTYKSNSNIPVYFKGTITIGGNVIQDSEAIFIAPGNYKTVTYEIENLPEDLTAKIFTIYGESEKSLDQIFEQTIDVSRVEILDNCQIDIISAKYNKQNKEFKINIKNIAQVDCWINLEISDLNIGYEQVTIGTKEESKIYAGKSKTILIAQELTDEDIAQNPIVTINAQFGEREDGLVKSLTKNLPLTTERFGMLTYLIIVIVVLIVVLIIIILILKKRKEKEEEGY